MKVKLYIKRKIAAAHFLPDYDGPCANLHGHTFLVEVWLEGNINHTTGMLVDFRSVKRIIDTCDHCTLNDVLPKAYQPPTAEHLAMYFLDQIPYSVKVRVWESDNCMVEVCHATT